MGSVETIIHNRDEHFSQTAMGSIRIHDKWFCWTLEDTVRAYGIKVYGYTAFPANSNTGYKVGIRYSQKFKREVIVIYTEEDGVTLTYAEISFTYVYAHGGNKHEHTDGCCLVGYNREGNEIWNTAEEELFNFVKGWLDAGKEVRWVTTNLKYSK